LASGFDDVYAAVWFRGLALRRVETVGVGGVYMSG